MRPRASLRVTRAHPLLLSFLGAAGATVACSGGPSEAARASSSADTTNATGAVLSYGGSVGAGKCLDVPAGISKGAEVDSTGCNGSAAQQFTFAGSAIHPASNPSYCLDLSQGDPQNGVVQLWPCNGLSNQQWITQNGTIRPLLQAQQSFCLDVPTSNASSIRVDLQPCNGSVNQLWWPAGATVQLQSALVSSSGNLCLDVRNDSDASGTGVDNWGCGATNDAQIFTLTAQSEIKNHGKCLGPVPGTHTGPLEMVNCDGALDQQWQFGTGPDGKLNIQGWGGGLALQCLDVQGGSNGWGTTVDLTTCNGSPAQDWSPIMTTGDSPPAPAQLPMTGPYVQQLTPVDDYVQAWLQSYGIRAATVAITYDKMLVYQRGFGWQDQAATTPILPDARMRLATNSTMLTRRALQQLVADRYLSPTTYVQQYLSQFFTLPQSTDARMAQIQVQDIYNYTTCTTDSNYQRNDQIEELENSPVAPSATDRIAYLWAHPQYVMQPSSVPCTVGSSTNNGFSHVSHEIAAAVIAAAVYKMSGYTGFNDPTLTGALGVGNLFGQYIEDVVGPRVGARFYEADDDHPGAPGSSIPNEIWYDDTGDGQQCPEWNYWACKHLGTQPPVDNTVHYDFFARPGSGTIVSSAPDVARFLVSYDFSGNNLPLPNSRSQMAMRGNGGVSGGDLAGTKTLMSNGVTYYGGQYHTWTWTLLANRDNGVDTSTFDIARVLDNGVSGVFNTFQPTVDFWVDDTIENRWLASSIYEGTPLLSSPTYVGYSAGSAPLNAGSYAPYDQLPDVAYLWRVQPDVNGFSVITSEMSGMVLSDQNGKPYVESLTPQPTWWSEEWSVTPAPSPSQGYTQLTSRWNQHGLHVQDQSGYVEEGPIASTWWSADWTLTPVPSGICCTGSTSTNACPAGQSACICGAPGCPAFQP